jgi:hypothetical protein
MKFGQSLAAEAPDFDLKAQFSRQIGALAAKTGAFEMVVYPISK